MSQTYHKSITWNRIVPLIEADEGYAICLDCGADYDGHLEPDAHGVECTSCGVCRVCGVQEIAFIVPISDENENPTEEPFMYEYPL